MRTRNEVIKQALSWIGKKESDGSYKEIIDVYNSYPKLPRGVKLKYTDPWCAGFCSAVAVKLGYTDIIPIEISCNEMINKAKVMGIWQENDAHVPSPADLIIYDWDDNGIGDNAGYPDHVGIVESVSNNYITVIEGNYSNAVKKRTISVNGKYIRGFITPRYDADSAANTPTTSAPFASVSKADNNTIAHEVIAGKWGSGNDRKTKLTAAGYNYDEVQKLVNQILNGSATKATNPVQDQAQTVKKEVIASCKAKKKDDKLAGTYATTADLYCRNDAGTNMKALCVIPKGTKVQNYGYYNETNGMKWLYIQFTMDGVRYTGFSSSAYLKK